MTKISIFNGISPKNAKEISIRAALNRIKLGESKNLINKIRNNQADKINLPSVTFAGQFDGERKISKLKKASGIAILDFDNLHNPKEFRDEIFKVEFIHATWISPSGTGVKALVRIPEVKNNKEYKLYYRAILDNFADADQATSDVSRLCFESYDPDIRIRDLDKTSIFEDKAEEVIIPANNGQHHTPTDTDKLFDQLCNGVSRSNKYKDGRNNYLFVLTANCNEFGIPQNIAARLMQARFPDVFKEELSKCISTIRSGYMKKELFGTKSMKEDPIDNIINGFKATPYKPTLKRKAVSFPSGVFPDEINLYIDEQNKISSFDKNLLSSSFLWMMSTLIGNKASLKVSDTWNDSPVMWMMVVADRGSTKTHALNSIIAPAKAIQKRDHERFQQEVKRWTEKSKEPRPVWKQIFIEDGTREGFIKAMNHNPGGLGLVKDELTGWLSDMDKHAGGKGGDEAFWISSYNNTTYTKNIKGDDDATFVSRLFMNLIGGIQPGILNNFTGDHIDNGLFDRFFMVPFEESTKLFNIYKEDPKHSLEYERFIQFAYDQLNLVYAKDGKTEYHFDNESSDAFEQVYRYFQKIKFNTEVIGLKEYISKVITQIPRVALTIEITDQLSSRTREQMDDVITASSIYKAKDILIYFLSTADRVLFQIGNASSGNDIIKASRAIKKIDKAKALLIAVSSGEIEMTKSEIARKTGVERTYLYKLERKIKESKNGKSV